MESAKKPPAVVKKPLTEVHYETCPGNRVVIAGLGPATPHGPALSVGPVYPHEEDCMSFVTTVPEALAAAATELEGVGSGMTAQNAAATATTTAIAPAAADEVSALQATQFSAFGNLYQSVSAQAQAIHQQMVNALSTNAGSYGQAETANQAAAGSTPLSGLFGSAQAAPTNANSGGTLAFAINQGQNFSAAASDLISQATIGTLPGYPAGPATGGAAGGGAIGAAGFTAEAAAPVGSAGLAGATEAPVLAGLGGASSVGGMSVPPAWAAGEAVPAATATPAALVGQGWAGASPAATPVSTVPAGMPAMATAGKASGIGSAPRYGAKPTVMPKPAVV